ncbi:alpha/beta fold hydrolase [Nocardia sp. alder85J]|uniref:alpha/beta fold hydrolase n=1 Tax=Nocardia sp. alder85J TaxID=2862949 RepID=UPI001CD20B27|nr:alpha/beta fold hydrolase [Nocardia sp. alder85J]MCX4097196.1 alpha/beta fold hydrolase [Nocardia sp. alder85J]
MPFARAIDAEIHYEDTGGDGPVVLLGHEFFMDTTMFAAQVTALAPDYRIVTWDARGHGRTRDEGLPFTYWTAARDALTVLDHLGVHRAVVGGASQGGFSALRTALLSPDRVAALVLIATEAHPASALELETAHWFLDRWSGPGSRYLLAEQLAGRLIGDDPWHCTIWTQRWVTRDPRATEAAANCLLARDSIVDRLSEIACPALVIHPALAGVPRRNAVELARRLADSRFVEIPGAHQAVTMTHPAAVNAALGAFLDELALSN